jgi:hypothetical protein
MKNTKLFVAPLIFVVLAFVIVFVIVTPFGAIARADRVDYQTRHWVDSIRSAARAKLLSFEVVDPASNIVNNSTRARLLEISEDQAQIWADTILGGDFLAEEEVILDRIEFVRLRDQVVGYRVTYSSWAYDTSECDAERDLKFCQRGRIVESSFVSTGLDSWIRDDQNYAEFVSSLPSEMTCK